MIGKANIYYEYENCNVATQKQIFRAPSSFTAWPNTLAYQSICWTNGVSTSNISYLDVANICIDLKKHMITTSYVKEEMQNLDKNAKDAGILILNEIGLDPGIDHMSAVATIRNFKAKGGKINQIT